MHRPPADPSRDPRPDRGLRGGGLASLAAATLALLAAATLACGPGLEARLEEAQALHQLGQVDQSIAMLHEILEKHPDHPAANQMLGAVLLQSGQPALAAAPLRKARGHPEQAVGAGLLLASAHVSSQQFGPAIEAADAVLQRDPGNVAALRIRAQSRLQLGRPEQALGDVEQLLAAAADDAHAMALKGTALLQLQRLDEAEAAFLAIRETGDAQGDPSAAARGCATLARFYAEGRGEPDRAAATFDECLAAYPTDPWVLASAVAFFDARGQADRAEAILRQALEVSPDDLQTRTQLATRLHQAGRADEADALMVQAAQRMDAEGWEALAQFRRRMGRPEQALEALDRALSLASENHAEVLRFARADLLLDLGRIEEAESLAASLALSVYEHMIEGRLHLLRGEPAEALASFEQGIRSWPNNPESHYMAGLAAERLGDGTRALQEYQTAARIDPRATDAALRAAHLFLLSGQPEPALNFATRHLAHRVTGVADAVLLVSQAHAMAGHPRRGVPVLESYVQRDPEPRVVAALGTLVAKIRGPRAGAERIEAVGADLSDPAQRPVLRQWVQLRLAAGQAEAALRRVAELRGQRPDSAGLAEIEGRILASQGRPEEARARFGRALALDPQLASAVAGLGGLEAGAGRPAEAIALLDRAARLDPRDPEPAYRAAQLTLATGETRETERRLRALLATHPLHASACNDLAWILAEGQRELDLALALAQRAAALTPRPEILDTLGWVRLRRGEAAEAAAVLRRALDRDLPAPSVRYRLGLALAAQGDVEGAARAFRRALESGAFPESEQARAELARLDVGPSDP